jgi:tetratricopeptide (TPR) repeat protein
VTADETGQAPQESEQSKKEREELEKKNAEIQARNEKVTKTNDLIAQAFKEGNAAFTAGDFDLAITKYDEGLAADPDFLGSVPTLTNNRSAALAARAIATYNKAAKMTEPSERSAALAKVKQDFVDAAAGFQHSWDLLKTPPPTTVMDAAQYEKVRSGALRGGMDVFEKAVRTKQVDEKLIESAKVLVPEFINIETDAAKKRAANLDLGDLYRIFGDSENAVAVYQKILDTSPDDLEALSGAGFSLVNLGYLNNDKDKLQQGANMLQRFATLAPDTNKYKADAVGLLETLKAEQNVAPQKTAGGKKKQ